MFINYIISFIFVIVITISWNWMETDIGGITITCYLDIYAYAFDKIMM